MSKNEPYKGTVLDFRTIEACVKSKSQELDIDPSRAFIVSYLEAKFDLADDDALDCIVDGSNDCGIDAVYIDNDSDNDATVTLLQSKYHNSEKKFDRAFEGVAIDKMQYAIKQFILSVPKSSDFMCDDLKNKIADIRTLKNPKYNIVFISNTFPPTVEQRKKFDDFLKEENHGQDYLRCEYEHLLEISDLLAPIQRSTIEDDLQLSGEYMNVDDPAGRTLIGRISGERLAGLMDRHGNALFERNVRGYLSPNKDVNKAIMKTATGSDSYKFFLMNNGITIVCDDMSYTPVSDNPLVHVKNLQIVNGGQTTNTLYEAYKAGKLRKDVSVLVKIIKAYDAELLGRITESTNSQSTVTARDLHSNDRIQKRIEAALLAKGYYYEARKDKYKGKKDVSVGQRIDALKAAQAYYAGVIHKPADAKNRRRYLFSTYYDDIFNDQLNIDAFLDSYLLWKDIRKRSRSYKNEYSFANYSVYHALAVLNAFGFTHVTESDRLDSALKSVMEIIASVVEEERKKIGDEYSHRVLFINPKTYDRIIKVAEQTDRIH
ncbi:AIPR family protein [Bifidobacterium apis]|uniref:AIPR family protein n=1 Tax=Bifidobacterium apis TaxID=3081440 RepID=UPI0030D96D56